MQTERLPKQFPVLPTLKDTRNTPPAKGSSNIDYININRNTLWSCDSVMRVCANDHSCVRLNRKSSSGN